MRWDALFSDLEAAAEAEERLEYEAEVAEQVRAEVAAVRLADRLRAHVGSSLRCRLREGIEVDGVLQEAGEQWLLLRSAREQVLAPAASLVSIDGLGRSVAPPGDEVARRTGLGVVLRRLAVRRVPVRLVLCGGDQVTGTIDRVGADHLDLAVHAPEVLRRAAAVRSVRTVPLRALICLVLLAA